MKPSSRPARPGPRLPPRLAWLRSGLLALAASLAVGPANAQRANGPDKGPARRPGLAARSNANPQPGSNAPAPATLRSVAELAASARASLVVLSAKARDGVGESVGTGFVMDASGLVATSLHVVGEGRPVTARLVSGRELEIESMHAFDRHTDLAILRVRATNLPALPLARPGTLAVGSDIIALGNPMGLENSVVSGVLSGRRLMDGVDLLQLAIPIEPGNSGGPVIDREGRVHGIVNAKSLLTRNLGFATPVELLQPLVENPSPVPYARWIRTGQLDPAAWEPRLGSRWRQRSGAILVEGAGAGFGGRSYLPPTLEPRAEDQPIGTSVEVSFRGASAITYLNPGQVPGAGTAQDNDRGPDDNPIDPASTTGQRFTDYQINGFTIDQWGDYYNSVDPPFDVHRTANANPGLTFLAGDSTWKTDVAQIEDAVFYQVRLTFFANIATGESPEVSAFALSWTQ